MKNHFLRLLLPGVLLASPGFCQNHLPVIKNLSVTADQAARRVTIQYALEDNDNDNLKVTFKVSSDGGLSYLVDTKGAQGDLGYPVAKGAVKKITWQYSDTIKSLKDYSIKLVADDLYKVNIQELVNQVDTLQLKKELAAIYGNRCHKTKEGLDRLTKVREYLKNNMKGNGLKAYRQKVEVDGYMGYNYIGHKPGHEEERKAYVLGAHYDTVKDSPGADDNGSGVSGMLEAMRILSKYNFAHTINFVAFDLEEEGLHGGREYADDGLMTEEKLAGMINFDMIGYYSTKEKSQHFPEGMDAVFPDAYKQVAADNFRGDFILSTVNEYSKSLGSKFSACAAKYVPELEVVSVSVAGRGENVPTLRESDHAPFWDNGKKALFLGDTAFNRNKHYHSATDKPENLNYTQMASVVKATVAMLAEMAGIQHSTVAQSPVLTSTQAP